MRHRTRSDENSKEIDRALRDVGASVVPLGNVGSGVPDRLVGFRGRNFLLEYKTVSTLKERGVNKGPENMLTPDQVKFFQTWQGERPAIVFTSEEALKAIGL
jgi:hypothetical protein